MVREGYGQAVVLAPGLSSARVKGAAGPQAVGLSVALPLAQADGCGWACRCDRLGCWAGGTLGPPAVDTAVPMGPDHDVCLGTRSQLQCSVSGRRSLRSTAGLCAASQLYRRP